MLNTSIKVNSRVAIERNVVFHCSFGSNISTRKGTRYNTSQGPVKLFDRKGERKVAHEHQRLTEPELTRCPKKEAT